MQLNTGKLNTGNLLRRYNAFYTRRAGRHFRVPFPGSNSAAGRWALIGKYVRNLICQFESGDVVYTRCEIGRGV